MFWVFVIGGLLWMVIATLFVFGISLASRSRRGVGARASVPLPEVQGFSGISRERGKYPSRIRNPAHV
jgi:hypothetical protein